MWLTASIPFDLHYLAVTSFALLCCHRFGMAAATEDGRGALLLQSTVIDANRVPSGGDNPVEKRIAWDGNAYTIDEFVDFYRSAGYKLWAHAPVLAEQTTDATNSEQPHHITI